MALVFIGWIIYVIRISVQGYINENNELEEIYRKSLSGKIIRSAESTRSYQYFDVKNNATGEVDSLYLHASYFFNENKMQINDSVSKTSNSKILTFYKKIDGKYVKCCDYELEM